MSKKFFENVKVILVLVLIFVLYSVCSIVECHDLRECTVYKVEGDLVTYEDGSGFLWGYETTDLNFKNENQKYILIMDNNHTDNVVTDDRIVKIKIKKEKGKED